MTPTLLLTGFESFGGDHCNPSGTIAHALHGSPLPGGARIHSLTLPVSGPEAWRKLSRMIRRVKPHWIIATGVSARSEISLESTAWNEDDFRIPDKTGRQPRSAPIIARGPASLRTGFHPAPQLTGFSSAALAIRVSNDPGRYVCNHLYYRLLHLAKNPLHCSHQRALFLHLPCTPEMRRDPADSRFFHPWEELRKIVLTMLESVVKS